MSAPRCAGCGSPFEPILGAPYVCRRCEDDDKQAPDRRDYDVPLFPIGANPWSNQP